MKFKKTSLDNSAEFSSTIIDNFYPEGQIIVESTSFSREGNTSRTLTSRTASEIQMGDALYRDPKFAHSFFMKSVGSSLNSLVTAGAEAVYYSPSLLTIDNPEDGVTNASNTSTTGTDTSTSTESSTQTGTKTTISGGVAFNRIMSETLLSRKAGTDFIDRSTRLALEEMSNTQVANPDYVAFLAHANTPYNVNGSMLTTNSRTVVLDSAITAEEKGWILARGSLLKSYNVIEDGEVLTGGFVFDIPNGLANLTQTKTYFPSMQPDNGVEQYIVDSSAQTAYICPSMIELLIFLRSKMNFRGKLGTNVSLSAQSSSNTALTANSSVNDHVFGRGFDITFVESKSPSSTVVSVDLLNNGTDVNKYRSALEHFLSILNVTPTSLLPDLVVISSDLATELSIVPDNEPVSSPLKVKYSRLTHVNFSADPNHRGNIHISFSAQRSGQYTGPNGTMGVSGTFLTPVSGGFSDPLSVVPQAPVPSLTLAKFKKNFSTDRNGTLTRQEVFDLLRGTILSDEAAAIFVAVVGRESNYRPAAFNPRAKSSSGNYSDWSVGMFQHNLLTTAHGKKTHLLPITGSGTVSVRKGYLLGYKNASAEGIDETNFNERMWNKYKTTLDANGGDYNKTVTSLFPVVDPNVWVPWNQASMLYTLITGATTYIPLQPTQKIASTAETGYIFRPWGDYGGKAHGFIGGTDFKNAVDVYRTTGKDPVLLRRWTITMFNATTESRSSDAYPYHLKWVDGWVYPVEAGEPRPPSEPLYPNVSTGATGGVTDTSGKYPVTEVILPKGLIGVTNGNIPASLLVPVNPRKDKGWSMYSVAAVAWEFMYAAALSAGINLNFSGNPYRSYERQVSLFLERYTSLTPTSLDGTGKVYNGVRYYRTSGAEVATPGNSNHGLGLAVDLTVQVRDEFVNVGNSSTAMNWLLANAAKFGFSWELQSEPWHLRYWAGDQGISF